MKLIRFIRGVNFIASPLPAFSAPLAASLPARHFTHPFPSTFSPLSKPTPTPTRSSSDFFTPPNLRDQLKKLAIWESPNVSTENGPIAVDKKSLIETLQHFLDEEKRDAKLAGRFFPEQVSHGLPTDKLKAVNALLQVVKKEGANPYLLWPFIETCRADEELRKLYELACVLYPPLREEASAAVMRI